MESVEGFLRKSCLIDDRDTEALSQRDARARFMLAHDSAEWF